MRRLVLVVLLMLIGSVLVLQHLRSNTGDARQQLAEASNICTDLHGNQNTQAEKFSACNRACTAEAGAAYRDCLLTCRKEAEQFGNCLLEQTTPR